MSIQKNIVSNTSVIPELTCEFCEYVFTRNSSLKTHIEDKRCPILKQRERERILNLEKIVESLKKNESNRLQSLEETLISLKNEVSELKNQAQSEVKITEKNTEDINSIRNLAPVTNNLQVMCVNSNDNFLDILTMRSNVQEALTFIKDCALSRLAGDCRLLEKVYFSTPGARPPIMTMNQARTRFVYYNEKNQKVLETNPKVLARTLADCLQRTYLKGINLFRSDVSDPDSSKVNHLESYDVEDWNEHIHDLSDEKYQKKILDRLKIPCVTD